MLIRRRLKTLIKIGTARIQISLSINYLFVIQAEFIIVRSFQKIQVSLKKTATFFLLHSKHSQLIKQIRQKQNNMNMKMNRFSERHNPGQSFVPSTPNLEHYKLHGKNKTKKKNSQISTTPIQPTQQPTISRSPKVSYCQNHPQKIAPYNTEANPNKKMCMMCALNLQASQDLILDNEQEQKRSEIEQFKSKVTCLRQSIESRGLELQKTISSQQQKYHEYFLYLKTSFDTIINEIDEKHQELHTNLIESINKEKEALRDTQEIIQEVKQSTERYIYDINKNYEGILKELAIESFRKIMQQYNAKIDYYNENILKKLSYETISIYLPLHEMRRLIEKATVSYYDRFKSTPHGNDRKSESKPESRKHVHGNGHGNGHVHGNGHGHGHNKENHIAVENICHRYPVLQE